MSSISPGDRAPHHGTQLVNEFIYRHIGHVLATRTPGERIDDPHSLVAQAIDVRIAAIQDLGIEPLRITVASAVAHIQLSGQRGFIAPEGEARA
jgi:hypothetical protein